MGHIDTRVVTDPIDYSEAYRFIPSEHHGAMNVFSEMVRNRNLGKDVVAVEYDCYIDLCTKVFNQIAVEAQQKWASDANILIIHRHGRLLIGEPSVLIVATTGHRDESYRITRYIIEEIKVRAPIWKKEFYTDGATDWVRGHALCQHRKVDHHEHSHGHTCGG